MVELFFLTLDGDEFKFTKQLLDLRLKLTV